MITYEWLTRTAAPHDPLAADRSQVNGQTARATRFTQTRRAACWGTSDSWSAAASPRAKMWRASNNFKIFFPHPHNNFRHSPLERPSEKRATMPLCIEECVKKQSHVSIQHSAFRKQQRTMDYRQRTTVHPSCGRSPTEPLRTIEGLLHAVAPPFSLFPPVQPYALLNSRILALLDPHPRTTTTK
jgi:hypothetical protein